jgi:Skp family chaperone for outer membrane proteins
MTLSIKQSLLLSSCTLLILAQTAHAVPGMGDQQMMQKLEKAQKCFSQLDQSKFKEFEAKSRKMETEIKALCAAGKRDKAMSTAMKFSKQMHSEPHLKEMQKCSELMEGAMTGMSQSIEEEQEETGHVCDNM